MKKPRRPIPKDLTQPIKWTGPSFRLGRTLQGTLLGGQPTPKEQEEHERKWQQAQHAVTVEAIRKLGVLKDYYEIDDKDPTSWPFLLVLAMARDYFPGFRTDYGLEPKGRKKTWTVERYLKLHGAVEALKLKNTHRDDAAAIRYLVGQSIKNKTGPYLPKGDRRAYEKTLMNRLSEARSPKYNMMAIPLARMQPDSKEREMWIKTLADVFGNPETQ